MTPEFRRCEVRGCPLLASCPHYCSLHHNLICMQGVSPGEVAEQLQKQHTEAQDPVFRPEEHNP